MIILICPSDKTDLEKIEFYGGLDAFFCPKCKQVMKLDQYHVKEVKK